MNYIGMRSKINMLVVSIFFISLFTNCATGPSTKSTDGRSAQLVEIETRSGVIQKFVLLQPQNPVASVILFSGGRGKIESHSVFGKPYIGNEESFLVFTRELFVEKGFSVAVIDVPSDRSNLYRGMWDAWRLDDRHVVDIKGVVEYLKQHSNTPVFLAGHSMGSISVANAAIKLGDILEGIVLSSSVTISQTTKHWEIHKKYPNAILDLDLDKIIVPVMIVAHEDDKCLPTPPTNAQLLKAALVNSPKVELIIYSGGKKPKETKGCTALGAHSYYGIENKVVFDICAFFKSTVGTK